MIDEFVIDPVCKAVYYLYREGRSLPDSPDLQLEFMLWLLVHGRKTLMHPMVIPDPIIDTLTRPDTAGRHALMDFAVRELGPNLLGNNDLVRAYYYNEVLYLFGSTRFIGASESKFLADCEARRRNPLPLSELSNLYIERCKLRPDGKTAPELSLLRSLVLSAPTGKELPSVSIIGFHRSVLGIGEDARNLFHALLEAGIRPELIDVSPPSLEPLEEIAPYAPFEAKRPTAGIIIFCMPPFEMVRTIATLGLEGNRAATYRIGIWPWETTALPEDWLFTFDFVDEVWAISRFLRDVFRSQTEKQQVAYMPLPVEVEQPLVTPFVEEMIGGAFCVLSIFDFNSRIERKNPIGTIRAFRKAFPSENKDVRLILKTINQSSNNAQFDLIMREIGDDERIVVVDGILSRNELCALIASVDVYLSLHRSEGLGRPLVEAMLLGTPVVATQWSGPEDYLTTDTGYPIRSKLRPVLEGEYPHAAGEWADPDLEQAAQALRTIYTNKEDAQSRSTAARRLVCEKYSTHSISQKLTSHFKALDESRAGYRRKWERAI